MKNKFTIKEICLMGIMAALGVAAKPVFSPFFNLITDFIRIPGGSCTAGISMLFLVFMSAYTHKFGTAFLMGAVQAVIALGSGVSAVVGMLVFITYTLPGLAIDFVMCSSLFKKMNTKIRMMLAGASGVLAGAGSTNILYFHLSFVPFLLFYIFGILSGALGGYIAYILQNKLPKNI